MLAGIGLTLVAAVLAWCASAFLLRWQHDARCAATFLLPAAVVAALALYSFFSGRGFPEHDRGWSVVFCLVSLFAGAVAATVALPVWLLMEKQFGWRAR